MSNIQTALERALPIVAAAYGEQFGVKVVLSGSDAYTDGETIVLPMLKSMSELKDVLFGYLAHEASHVKNSCFDTIKKCKSPLEKSFLNIIEDIRIEQLIQEEFPGTQFTLNAVATYVVEQGMSLPATPEDNEASQLHQYLLHRLRAEILDQDSSKPLAKSSLQVVEQTFPLGFFIRLDGLLAKHMNNLSCSDDCLLLARAIMKALEEAEEEQRQQELNDQNQQQDDNAQSQDEQSQNGDGTGQDAKGSSQSQTDQAGSSNDEQVNQGQEGSSSSRDAGDDSNQVSSQGGSPADDSRSTDQQSSTNDSQTGSQGSDAGLGDKGASLHEKVSNETNLPEDAISNLKGELSQQAIEDNNGQRFDINTSSVGDLMGSNGDTSSLATGILASSALRSRLLGLLQAQSRQKEWLHTRGNRVSGKRLSRLATGDSRVFIKREELKKPETAVHVLLDTSGSMDATQDIANHATVSLALAISSIPKCDIAVSMFPGVNGAVSPMVHRGQPVRANLGRFAVTSHGGTPLAEAMLYAARELSASPRQRKVLIIITDGAPNNAQGVHYLNSLIDGHIDTYAIGIATTAVSRFFENWSTIQNISELQSALFKIAGNFLELN
ncbi:VWA domain-containing protein [Alkalimarinus alittae]|uniref:VWA domain-containing protein n=1 Tax=Alkalimarinus alittae TaxID=2961619 RepID=A0ABY6N576_9ALTE|nr:VWA domain-containing protein [Alkalimarinus alittae]UZE97265.1 VWA domain-containing protein [Alkalimarinus alittae]